MRMLRFLPRFFTVPAKLATMAERETWTRAQITRWQLERINNLWLEAIECVPYYRQLYKQGKLPDRFDDLQAFASQVPVLEKEWVRQRSSDFLSDIGTKGRWRVTGGSTGKPTSIFWSDSAHRINLLARYRYLQAWGVNFLDRQLMLWGPLANSYPPERKQRASWEQAISDTLRGRLRISPQSLNAGDRALIMRQIQAFRPTSIYGFSSAVYQLVLEGKLDQETVKSLKLCIVTGEATDCDLSQRTEASLGVPVITEYGSMDCGILAYEQLDRSLTLREDHFYFESQLRSDGRYDLLVTSLINLSFPLVRYRIGDIIEEPIVTQSVGFAKISPRIGRSVPMLQPKCGRVREI